MAIFKLLAEVLDLSPSPPPPLQAPPPPLLPPSLREHSDTGETQSGELTLLRKIQGLEMKLEEAKADIIKEKDKIRTLTKEKAEAEEKVSTLTKENAEAEEKIRTLTEEKANAKIAEEIAEAEKNEINK